MNLVTKIIPVELTLLPHEIKKNFQAVLRKKIDDLIINKAFDNYGIITEIQEVKNIKYQEINEISTAIHVIVEILVQSYRPNIGDKIESPIKKIFNYGLFFSEKELRILVPLSKISSNWTLDKYEEDYVLKKESCLLQKNDKILLEIVDVRFEKNGFSCIAKFANDNKEEKDNFPS